MTDSPQLSGKGYHASENGTSESNKRMGVMKMSERAELLGGELEIESTPGKGATVFVRVSVAGR